MYAEPLSRLSGLTIFTYPRRSGSSLSVRPAIFRRSIFSNYSGGRPIDEVAYLFNNEGSADTPLYIEFTIGSQAVNNIAIKVYRRNSNDITGIMLLDSPGYSDSNATNYYAGGSRIIIDSRERTVTYNGDNIAHHIRSAEEWTATTVQNLPINLPPGETRVGFHNNMGNRITAGPDTRNTTIAINAKIRDRWK